MDGVVERIRAFNAGREPERLAMKYAAMRRSPFAFFRGTCHLFYEDWPKDGALDGAPAAWICGDLHFENFGTYKGDNRLGYFDLNDFDEACLAPATWELTRFITSLHLAAHSFGVEDAAARTLARTFLDSYAAMLREGKARWVERQTAVGLVRKLLRIIKQRTRRELLDIVTVGRRAGRAFRIDDRRLPVSRADRAGVVACIKAFAASEHCPEEFQGDFFRVLDVARRVAGTGSLGIRRFAVLVQGHGAPDGHFVIDLKEARPSALAPYVATPQPAWPSQAARVVSVQRRAEAIAPALLHPVAMGRVPYVLKELQPSIDRLALTKANAGKVPEIMGTMAHVVAWSHLRSASREGAATADAWLAFGAERWWIRETLVYARRYRNVVRANYDEFAEAYDAGAFTVSEPAAGRRVARRR